LSARMTDEMVCIAPGRYPDKILSQLSQCSRTELGHRVVTACLFKSVQVTRSLEKCGKKWNCRIWGLAINKVPVRMGAKFAVGFGLGTTHF
jgi:hypothetical protein